MAALVCLLSLSVFSLASLAKCSQYRTARSEGYLAKAVKIAGARCQTPGVAVPVTVLPHIERPDALVRFVPPDCELILPQAVFLESFHFRPPPVRFA